MTVTECGRCGGYFEVRVYAPFHFCRNVFRLTEREVLASDMRGLQGISFVCAWTVLLLVIIVSFVVGFLLSIQYYL